VKGGSGNGISMTSVMGDENGEWEVMECSLFSGEQGDEER
jgi:hypothetical protein